MLTLCHCSMIYCNLYLCMYYTCRTQIVGDNSASAGELKTCIDKWLVSGADAAQSFVVGGSILMVCVSKPCQYSPQIPYSRKFSLDKNFTKSSYLCIAEIFNGINFRQRSKGHHILYNVRTKKFADKNFTNGSRWRNWQKFSPGKISAYTTEWMSVGSYWL